jgi:hypothetical protein
VGIEPFANNWWNGYLDGMYSRELSVILGTGEDAFTLEQLDYPLSVYIYNQPIVARGSFMVDWDIPPDMRAATPGVYEITGRLRLPACFVMAEDLIPTVTIYVIERDFIVFTGPTRYTRMGEYVFEWLWEIPDLSKAELYYAFNDGEWEKQETQLSNDFSEVYFYDDIGDIGYFESNAFYLYASYLEPGRHYFQLAYEGRYSNVLQVTVTPRAQGFGYNIDFNIGGDRDGTGQGDQGGSLPPVDPLPVDPSEPQFGNDDGDSDNGRLPDTGDGDGEDDNEGNSGWNPNQGDNTPPLDNTPQQGYTDPQGNDRDTNNNTLPIVSGDDPFNGGNDGRQADTEDEIIGDTNENEQAEQTDPVEIEYIPTTLNTNPVDDESFQNAPVNTAAATANLPVTPQITLSANELDDLRATQPVEMTVIENNIKLVRPTYLLDGLELGEGEIFAVELEMEGNTFSVRLFAGEREIRGFSGETFLVYILYDSDVPLSALYCEDEQGNRFYAEGRDGDKVIFRLAETGSYTIHEETGTDTPAVIEGNEIPEAFNIFNGNETTSQNNSAMPWGMVSIIGGAVFIPSATLGIRRAKLRKKPE